MLSKCANPECSEQFRYLHQGKIFLLMPSPDLQDTTEDLRHLLYERFWLCDDCCRKMKLVWGGAQPKLVRLREETAVPQESPPGEILRSHIDGKTAEVTTERSSPARAGCG